jgi:hypothetical protein
VAPCWPGAVPPLASPCVRHVARRAACARTLVRLRSGCVLTPSPARRMAIMLTIFLSGLGAMMGIASPDRFEGDKSNMGRTRLEAGM